MMNRYYQFTLFISSISVIQILSAQSPTSPKVQINPYYQPQSAYSYPYGRQQPRSAVLPYQYQQIPQFLQRTTQAIPPSQPKKAFREYSGYLGLSIDLIPASVRAQLPTGISQGILVKEFSPNSPAINSELKPYDVIYAYEDKKIHHPAQFIKLVRDDEPGKTVTLRIVHQGQLKKISITLGSQKTPNPKEFNGLAIKQMGKDKYNALIRFIGTNGNKQMRSYKGTREEIFEQAINAQDLPQAEREQLLFATRPRGGGNSNSSFGSFFPFGGKNESGKDWMSPSRFFKW